MKYILTVLKGRILKKDRATAKKTATQEDDMVTWAGATVHHALCVLAILDAVRSEAGSSILIPLVCVADRQTIS
jgi:hypothetical protein